MITKIDGFYSAQLEMLRKKFPVLTQEEATLLAEKARKGDIEARNKLVLSNLCLIHVIARECKVPNAEIEDMIQDGYVELLEQASKFDFSKGACFSTFIWPWIKQRIFRANITISERNFNLIAKVNKMKENFIALNDRAPTEAEIADDLGMSQEILHEKLRQIDFSTVASLDGFSSDSDEEKPSLYNVKLNSSAETPEEEAVSKEIAEKIRLAVDSLPEKESTVIKYRNCMNPGYEKSLSFREIGSIMDISQETVRIYEKKAKNHLKMILVEQGIAA